MDKRVNQPIRVALLAGGKSGEREISLASGASVREALEESGYKVEVFDPSSKEDLKRLIDAEVDVAFPCLHGKGGEDGTVQGLLELLDIPYVGSGVFSSAVGMDKNKAKVFFEKAGLNVPRSRCFRSEEEIDFEDLKNAVGLPCVVKPAADGSALGVKIVKEAKELKRAIDEVFTLSSVVIVETYVSGTEVTAAVVGNDDPKAYPIIEIIPMHSFYDYDSKYAPGGSQHICPARLSDETTALVQSQAVKAHKALDCRGVSRSDFIIDETGVPWILETNTIPGMTSTSLLPDAARAAGVSFSDLCTLLIDYALEDSKR